MASADRRVTQSAVRQLLQNPRTGVDFEDLATELIDAFGGNRAFARLIHQQFTDSATGGMVKNQILKYVLGVLEKNASLTKDRPDSESRMSDEELLESCTALFAEFSQHEQIANGEDPEDAEGIPPSGTGEPAG